MASEEPTLEATETTLEEDAPPLSNAELRLLRLLLTRAAQPQLCRAHTVDFDRLPQPVQASEATATYFSAGDMAPKKLVEPSPSGLSMVNAETVADRQDFSTFRRWYSPQQFLETLRILIYFTRAFTGQTCDFTRQWRLMNFMAWITIPRSTFRMVMERAQQTGFFTLNANEVLGAPEHINFSLSPRSALLLYSFQLSISERAGQRYTLGGSQDNLVTIGLHFPTDLFEDLLQRGILKLWNRRYIDYFFRFEAFQMPIGPLLFSVTIVHRCHPYAVCDFLSRYFADVVQSNQLENFVPADFVLRSLRTGLLYVSSAINPHFMMRARNQAKEAVFLSQDEAKKLFPGSERKKSTGQLFLNVRCDGPSSGRARRAGEDVKPKVKEAEEINLPEFPSPETYRSWKTAARETIRAASDSPDEAFQWVLEVYRPDASHDGLRDPGKFLTLDTKLLKALTTVSRGELAREILIFKETEASKDRAVRGRQVLYLFDQYFKTNEEVGSLYSVEDLLKVRLVNDDLSTFLSNWESVISGLSHMPDETTLRDIFLRELRQSKRMEYDLEIYDRAKGGSEQHTYLFLKNSIKEMLTRRGSVRTVTGSHAPTVISTVQQLPRDQPAPPEEVKVASPER
ncbi:hypothetical protein AK812_SmicGene16204 [Symbiodinium microadriaticum]|uniref:Uncharacterized protein n=1 Tax=Symbiodinium microadriaticum TaxID=2951 RepID=A0A1Q9E0X7_SYMMI|nr:hypothetical protein AK812_SmicGene16204 [Symbiodinium microadriaticum]